MNLLKTIAVEDEGPALRRLTKMVEENPNLKLIGTARTSAEARGQIVSLNPDLLLLDIQLKDATAFDLLSGIGLHFSGNIIFVTAYDSYAVKAFEHEAVDYLLKPYTQERFNTAVNRVVSRNERTEFKDLLNVLKIHAIQKPKMLIIPEGAKNHFIEKEKLRYMTADGYYTNFVLAGEKKLIRVSLKKLEELLPENFVRINKSTIVNKDFIIESTHHKATARIIMSDKYEFYVSENFLDKLKNGNL